MRHLLLTFILLALTGAAVTYGQSATIAWDHPIYESYKKINSALLGADLAEKTFYFLKQDDQKYYIQKFNQDNQKIFDREVNFSTPEQIQNNSVSIIQFIMLKDRFVFLLLVQNEGKSEIIMFLQDVSLDATMIGGKKSVLLESGDLRGSYHLSLSPDSSKVALCLAIPKQKHAEKNQIDVNIYSNTLEEITSRKIYFSLEENTNFRRIQVKDILINNAGDIYILGDKFAKGISNCSVWRLAKDADRLDTISIGFIPKLKEYKLQTNSFGEPILIGLYADVDTKTKFYRGYYYGKINEENLSIALKTVLLPDEIQHPPFSSDGYYPEWEILNKKDGGQILILEYIWLKGNNPHFGDLLVLNLDSNGSLVYRTYINKNQSKYMGVFRAKNYFEYYSYLPVLDESKNILTVFFNDNPQNIEVTNEQAKSVLLNIHNSTLASVEINSKGNVSRTACSAPVNTEIIFCTGLRAKLGGESIIMGLKDEEVWLGKLHKN